jgi:16S rRNA (adenine1518-N6/adenine1519-N6)-dimethyltransferase
MIFSLTFEPTINIRYSDAMKVKKSLGQHWLKSEKALSQIINAGDIQANDLILEIGPGEGALTKRLILLAGKVIAVEKDKELVTTLTETFSEAIQTSRLEIIQGDILTWNPEVLTSYKKPYKLIANIPYYITGAIIEKFLSIKNQPERMVLLMQQEVAQRIVSKDGKESILSIAVKAYGKPKIIAKVPPGAFAPAPTVDSSILLIDEVNRDFFKDCDEQLFFRVLKAIFGKKRKQIGGSLADILKNREWALRILQTVGIDSKTRPEEIDLTTWKALIQALPTGK